MSTWRLPVGVRLPLPGPKLGGKGLLAIAREAVALGYTSVWMSDHLLLPGAVDSTYPHTADGAVPFPLDSSWPDPVVGLTWLAGQIDADIEFGTSVMIVPLRNPVVLAKQLTTLSWLSGRRITVGVGSGWLRDDYDAVDVDFAKRASAARAVIGRARELIEDGESTFLVGPADSRQPRVLSMRPRAVARVPWLWGGYSPAALRMVARCCDGWLPSKLSFEGIEKALDGLGAQCAADGRPFEELRLVVKPGPGPTPPEGAITPDNLERYASLGFSQAILEMPLQGTERGCIDALRSVAKSL